METILTSLLNLIKSPDKMSMTCIIFILVYYVVSYKFIEASHKITASSIWKKSGFFDWFTSIIWIAVSILLLISLFELAGKMPLTMKYLIYYYFFFVFLFAILYGLLEWHWPGMLTEIDSTSWSGELKYIIISLQTQTTLGYSRSRPNNTITEIVAAIQALLGIFFCILFIEKAV